MKKINLRKIIEEEYLFLLESKKRAYETFVKTKKIDDNTFNDLLQLDPSNNFQYIEKICQFYLELFNFDQETGLIDQTLEEKISDAFRIFDDYIKKRVPLTNEEKNIYNYKNWEQFIAVIEKYRNYKSNRQIEKEKRAPESPWEIVPIVSKEQSCKLGNGTMWCISGRNYNRYFYYRIEKEESFYFLMKGMKKFVFAIIKEAPAYKITDQQDKMIERGENYHQSEWMIKEGLNNVDFKVIPISKKEISEIDKSEDAKSYIKYKNYEISDVKKFINILNFNDLTTVIKYCLKYDRFNLKNMPQEIENKIWFNFAEEDVADMVLSIMDYYLYDLRKDVYEIAPHWIKYLYQIKRFNSSYWASRIINSLLENGYSWNDLPENLLKEISKGAWSSYYFVRHTLFRRGIGTLNYIPKKMTQKVFNRGSYSFEIIKDFIGRGKLSPIELPVIMINGVTKSKTTLSNYLKLFGKYYAKKNQKPAIQQTIIDSCFNYGNWDIKDYFIEVFNRYRWMIQGTGFKQKYIDFVKDKNPYNTYLLDIVKDLPN